MFNAELQVGLSI